MHKDRIFSFVRTCAARASSSLHARPAARLVRTVQDFDAELVLVHGNIRADARSILDILALSIQAGDWLAIEASGPDAEAALNALSILFASDFAE